MTKKSEVEGSKKARAICPSVPIQTLPFSFDTHTHKYKIGILVFNKHKGFLGEGYFFLLRVLTVFFLSSSFGWKCEWASPQIPRLKSLLSCSVAQ